MNFTWNNRQSCGELTESHVNQTICVAGWVDTTRDHGHLLFIHLRTVQAHYKLYVTKIKSRVIQTIESPSI